MSKPNGFDVVDELLEELVCACTTTHSVETVQEEEHDSSDVHCDKIGGCDEIDDEIDGCAICLEQIPFEDMAIIKGCEHSYCACCILKWVTFHRDAPRCPQCKAHFNYLYTYRCLDGTFCEHFIEESVTLLLRARWFQGKLPSMEDPCEDSEDEDEDYDSYYLSPQHRVVLGNRRFGANGVISNGRQHAAPRRQTPTSSKPAAAAAAAEGASSHSKGKGKERAERAERGEAKAVNAKKAARDAKKEAKASKEAARAAQRKAARTRPVPPAPPAEPAAPPSLQA
uniref:RING-type domain-containing protein n=1 Tax=Pyramimonas obovata TaxID=1411642 RepID=A0A7S0MTM1_9CHLO|mmetsp:Transcript_11241/g.23464  ORF Transcript_11241/g.23464 Transcript_11241/m.23464 type:complete len:283 (+) Transcript_11241:417-1265(+)|eukprot:CAMPEP_0118922052 /NCGR_PEP_ID=MMETSP1169-20130426/1116_1 /TAXON_ID=36882 /ORGANISM="Pyramimonas obovata, Strain CCMP722" /LENGTH=282 /DNA_ID=CAMNT_0006862867 /DNA_START=415 /DNA_END=1263 /DNA_ORIENTATION=+